MNALLYSTVQEINASKREPAYVLPKLCAIEGRATIAIGVDDGSRIATLKPSRFQWQRADAIITACNAYSDNQARIAELEGALKRVTDLFEEELAFSGNDITNTVDDHAIKQARQALGGAK